MATELIGPVTGAEDCPDCGLALEATLQDVLTELQTALAEGGTVSLSAGTLSALENITATISGDVSLSAGTLSALENVNAVVSGEVSLSAGSLAALETINAIVDGEVALDAATLAALENINALASIKPVTDLRTGRETVTNTATAIPAAPLTDRATVRYTNISDDTSIFFSEDELKIPADADVLLPQTSLELDLDATVIIYFATTSGTADMAFSEVGGI